MRKYESTYTYKQYILFIWDSNLGALIVASLRASTHFQLRDGAAGKFQSYGSCVNVPAILEHFPGCVTCITR